MYGPMTNLGHNSIIFMMECQVQLIINGLRHQLSKKAAILTIKDSVVQKTTKAWEKKIDESVWVASNCTSWYHQVRQNN
jgi:hypothetical protein